MGTMIIWILVPSLFFGHSFSDQFGQSISDQTTPEMTTPDSEHPSAFTVSSQQEIDEQEPRILERVGLPQNRIPLRFLQRNKYRQRLVTGTPEPMTTESPVASEGHRLSAVENMIMDKSRSNSAFVQESLIENRKPQMQIPASRPQSRPAHSDQAKNRQPRPRQEIRNSLSELDATFRDQDTIPVSAISPNSTISNSTIPLPVPVPLDQVPFYNRPQQAIKNRLIESAWERKGLNLTQYLAAMAAKNTTTTPIHNTTTSTTTMVTTIPTTEITSGPELTTSTSTIVIPTTQARSIFAEFMVNKNGNAREYLRAIYNNLIGTEQQQSPQITDTQTQQSQAENRYQSAYDKRVRA